MSHLFLWVCLNILPLRLICYLHPFVSQTLDKKAAADDDDSGGRDEGSSCLAFRTRSKHPLVNVPLGQLEAEFLAPDITSDMYEQISTQQEDDRQWTTWLQGLMVPAPEGQRPMTCLSN